MGIQPTCTGFNMFNSAWGGHREHTHRPMHDFPRLNHKLYIDCTWACY